MPIFMIIFGAVITWAYFSSKKKDSENDFPIIVLLLGLVLLGGGAVSLVGII